MSSPNRPAPVRATVGPAAKEGEPATLSRDLANFLVELSIAFHKHAIYPAGHPLLSSTVHSVTTKLLDLLASRPTLSIGIARRQLIIEGVATDPNHPLLHELANKLHRHHLGAVKFSAGITEEELSAVLATLAVDAGRMDRPLGLDAAEVSRQWEHARIFPLTYDKLELLDEGDSEDSGTAVDGQMRSGRAAQLWVGMARAALAADSTVVEDSDRALEPVAVARAIDEHQREQAYDQVIVGYMLQITDELKTGKGGETVALQRRISKMVGALRPETLERLLTMSGDNGQRRRFVLDAAQGMAVDAVVDLVRAAADAERQTISHSLVRLFAKLAKHTSDADATRSVLADRSLREQVKRLIEDWSLDDPNPDAYSLLLQEISHQAPVGENRSGISLMCEPERIVKIGLEVGSLGPRVEHAVGTMLERRQHADLFSILDEAPPNSPTEGVWRQIEQSAALRTALTDGRLDFAVIRRMVVRMKGAAANALLDTLEATTDEKQRERLLELVALVGDEAGSEIGRRLPLAPPPLQRDYLVLLGRLADLPTGVDLTPYATHSDSNVRREAVRLLIRQEGMRDATIVTALADADARTVFLGLTAAQERCPATAVPVIMKRVDRNELDAALRVLGIRVIAGRRDEATLPWLLGRVQRRTKWLKRLRLKEKSPEMLAALGALAATWSTHTAVHNALTLARKSKDADVRHAAASAGATDAVATAVR